MKEPIIRNDQLYRLPWTFADNAISWLEPTAQCNLYCDGCYRENSNNSHKPVDEIKKELDLFKELRRTDGVSIAGGDPLLHPQIFDIVKEIVLRKMKPIINTNGLALTKDFLKKLKDAGVFGFTFHIDSKQGRPHWKNKTEIELNELRLQYAELLAEEGNISCSFNATVYEDTLKYVPDLVRWAGEHIDIVQVMVFIAYRHVVPQLQFDWYIGGNKIDRNILHYSTTDEKKVDILSTDMVAEVRKYFPEFTPSGFLNGTEKPDSYKWLFAERVGTNKKILGYLGPKFLELIQTQYHLWKGTYLAYASPNFTKLGKTIFLFSFLDKGARKAAINYTTSVFKNPLNLFRKMHYQTILMIQPVDFLQDGRQNMCDGCPDITVWKDKLVWSCRLEELKEFGSFARTVPINGEK
jgi:organic radical activating enzyme